MAFLPTVAWEQKGFDEEQDKARRLRAENKKALQEAADLAAQQGRELSMDEWFQIQQEQVGSDGFLYNYAPANAVLESMRKSANEKAKVVQQQQRFDQFRREADMDKMVQGTVENMVRQGRSEAEITAQISQNLDPKVAQRYAAQIPSFIQRAAFEDAEKGTRLGMNYADEQEAEQGLKQFGEALTPSAREAAMAQARRNREKREQEDYSTYQGIVSKLNGYAYADDQTMRDFIRGQLPPRMEKDWEKHVEKAMATWRSIASGTSRIEGNQTRLKEQATISGLSDDALKTDQILSKLEQERAALQQSEAYKTPAEYQKAHADMISKLFNSRQVKSKESATAVRMAQEFLTSFEVDDPSAILLAIDQGDAAVKAAIDKARKNALPVSTSAANIQREAKIRYGIGFTGNAEQDYSTAIKSGEDIGLKVLSNEGAKLRQAIKDHGGSIGPVMGRKDGETGLWGAANAMARSFGRTRELLAQSGKFSASAEDFNNMENAAIWRHVSVYADSAGLDQNMKATLYAMVKEQLGGQQGLSRTPTQRDLFRKGIDETRARFQLPGLFGTNGIADPQPFSGPGPRMPSGYRPPSDPNAPF